MEVNANMEAYIGKNTDTNFKYRRKRGFVRNDRICTIDCEQY